jgi:hypothetical protein
MRELQSVRMLWRRPSLALRMWWTERPGVGMCFPCFMWNLDLNWKVCACPSHRGCEWDVVMPCLSGVGLLSKMMKREACKRVPVVSK